MKEKSVRYIKRIVLFIIVFGVMLTKHYVSDSYAYLANKFSYNANNFSLGRVGDYFVNDIMAKLGFDYVRQQKLFVLFLIVCLAFSTEFIYFTYIKNLDMNNNLLIELGVLALYCNVFIVEWLSFVEMDLLWGLSILFMTFSFHYIKCPFKVADMLKSLILLTISLSFYQAAIGYFVIAGMLYMYICHKGKLDKSTFSDNIKLLLVGALAGMINIFSLLLLQLFGMAIVTSRTGKLTIGQIIQNVNTILKTAIQLFVDTDGMYPKYLFMAGFLVLTLVSVLITYRKKGIWGCIYIFLLNLCSVGIVFFPHLMTTDIWMAQRTMVSFWGLLTVPCIVIAVNCDRDIWMDISAAVMGIMLTISAVCIQSVSANVIANSKLDVEYSNMIEKEIQKYEQSTGNTVTRVSMVMDGNPSDRYNAVDYRRYDMNIRTWVVSWGNLNCLNFYSQKQYEGCEMNEEVYENYFSGKDWDYWSPQEQLIFRDDTLYMAVY
ncbi:MAG: glucosyltransferase domain-containing protein [Ruminococcus flavefaciens]|nr:glucosyltransferase domain-containing protein [Ruminococcus flavefaciens]